MATRDEDFNKNIFYKNYYQNIIYIFIASIIVIVILTSMLFYQIIHRPLPNFSAEMPDGRGMMLTPYDEPNIMPATIIRWASKAAVAAYTFNFVDYEKQIALAKPYFTDEGWVAYQAAIANVIERVIQAKVFVYGVVTQPPVIVNQGVRPGHKYSWRIQIPFLVTYQGAEESRSANYYVILTVVKVPPYINPDSIGIEKFEMREI